MTDEQMARLKIVLRGMIVEEVARLPVREAPPGRDGRDGIPGAPGERGASGERGERGTDGLQGRDGAPGESGQRGEDGAPGERGERGADGIHGRDGAPGQRGADGIATREEFQAEVRSAVTVLRQEFTDLQVRSLVDLYRGVWKKDDYERGSLVTHEGSLFLALFATDAQPGTSEAWRLVTKRGRDGRDRH